MSKPVEIACFTDVLCVWAYVAHVRLEELNSAWGKRVLVHHHFINLFGDTVTRIGESWREKGGFAAFGTHVEAVCADFPQVEINPDVWRVCRPRTSGNAHLALKAVQLLETEGRAPAGSADQLAWQCRLAFFRDARDIADARVILTLAEQQGIDTAVIEGLLQNGEAMAALQRDQTQREHYQVAGSPTYVLNDGRQKLFGNVGYRILDANVRELLDRPETGASWC